MAELADALGSGPSDRKVVEVRVLLSAPEIILSARQLSALRKNKISGMRYRPSLVLGLLLSEDEIDAGQHHIELGLR